MQGKTWVDPLVLQYDRPSVLIQYIIEKGLQNHKDFKWVNNFVDLDYIQPIVKVMQAVTKSPQYKFGVELPKSVKHALWLDKKNGNNLWREAIEKELGQINDYNTFRAPAEGRI